MTEVRLPFFFPKHARLGRPAGRDSLRAGGEQCAHGAPQGAEVRQLVRLAPLSDLGRELLSIL